MVESLGAILHRFKAQFEHQDPDYVVFRDDEACLQCGRVRADVTRIGDIAEYRGMLVSQVVCRCAEEAQQELDRRVAAANLPAQTFETWEKRKGTKQAYAAAQAYSAPVPLHTPSVAPILMMVGTRGTGKSHLLAAIGHARLQRGETVRYEQTTDLLDRLKATYDHREGAETNSEVLDQLHGVKVLLLDDLGTEQRTNWSEPVLTALIDDRYRNGRWLVVTTNTRSQAEMEEHNGPRIADRLWDDQTGIVKQVYLTCSSYRTG